MNARSLFATLAIGLLYVLLASSLYLQYQRPVPLAIGDIRQAVAEEVTPLKVQIDSLEQIASKPPAATDGGDPSVGDRMKGIEEKIADIQTSLAAQSKVLGGLVASNDGGKSPDILSIMNDPRLFDDRVRQVTNQKPGRLIVSNWDLKTHRLMFNGQRLNVGPATATGPWVFNGTQWVRDAVPNRIQTIIPAGAVIESVEADRTQDPMTWTFGAGQTVRLEFRDDVLVEL